MSKTTDRTNHISCSDSINRANTPLSALDAGETNLFQQLVGVVIRTDALMGKAAGFLNLEAFEDEDIIEDIPAIISELLLNDLRISALLLCLEDAALPPEAAESFELAKAVQEDAQDVLAEMLAVFEDICGDDVDEESENAGDSGEPIVVDLRTFSIPDLMKLQTFITQEINDRIKSC